MCLNLLAIKRIVLDSKLCVLDMSLHVSGSVVVSGSFHCIDLSVLVMRIIQVVRVIFESGVSAN